MRKFRCHWNTCPANCLYHNDSSIREEEVKEREAGLLVSIERAPWEGTLSQSGYWCQEDPSIKGTPSNFHMGCESNTYQPGVWLGNHRCHRKGKLTDPDSFPESTRMAKRRLSPQSLLYLSLWLQARQGGLPNDLLLLFLTSEACVIFSNCTNRIQMSSNHCLRVKMLGTEVDRYESMYSDSTPIAKRRRT